MTDQNNPPRDKEDTDSGLSKLIRLLVAALAEAEQKGNTTFAMSGEVPGDKLSTEYGISGELGSIRPEAESEEDSMSRSSASPTPTDEYLIEARESGDELLVVADLPDIEAADITAGLEENRNELVLFLAGEEVERVRLPWTVADVESQFQHGILELRVTREVTNDE